MTDVGRGTLVIADIGGYTKYLTGVELEHSHDILADLISVVAQSKGTFTLAKLEGDAIFSYASEGAVDGSHLVAAIDSSYFAFRERLRDIAAATTCPCGACRLIPELTLKYVVHHGEYVVHEVMGNRELVGSDVILVHRLLKNDVVETSGHASYALFSEACLDHFGLHPPTLDMTPSTQNYDDVGRVEAFALDMDARWIEDQKRQNVVISPEEAWATSTFDVGASVDVVWDVITSPKRLQWMQGIKEFRQENPGGVRGVGTVNHCMHGKSTVVEHVLDWKPYDYFTVRSVQGKGMSLLFTWALTPLSESSTRVEVRLVGEGGRVRRRMLRMAAGMIKKKLDECGPEIETYLRTANKQPEPIS